MDIMGSVNGENKQERFKAFNRFRRVLLGRGLVVFGIFIILVTIVTAVFAPLIAPYDPYKQDLYNLLLNPCKDHLLGTDDLGRDTLSRIIYGSRASLMVGIFSIAVAAVIGMSLGLAAGYFGGVTNLLIMRFIDTLMAFPLMLKALVISALLGGGLRDVVIALGIGLIPNYSRMMCGQVLSLIENDYIIAARAIGSGPVRIMLRHLLPNSLAPMIVLMTMMMGHAILAEAGLSFLGVGIAPPGAAWGAMVSEGYQYLLTNPILSIGPGFAIMLVVFSFNMVGDGLRDALDPRLRGKL